MHRHTDMGGRHVVGSTFLVIGGALIGLALQASRSFWRETSRLFFESSQHGKALWLAIAGALTSAIGVMKIVRSSTRRMGSDG